LPEHRMLILRAADAMQPRRVTRVALLEHVDAVALRYGPAAIEKLGHRSAQTLQPRFRYVVGQDHEPLVEERAALLLAQYPRAMCQDILRLHGASSRTMVVFWSLPYHAAKGGRRKGVRQAARDAVDDGFGDRHAGGGASRRLSVRPCHDGR